MNRYKSDVLLDLWSTPFDNQRQLSERLGYSVGTINKALKDLTCDGYIDKNYHLTDIARALLDEHRSKNAIILAAGYGMRMVPLNMEVPKGLIEVNGERLMERTILQLHEAGITEIYIVVGFMKEQYEYLIDKYNVQLIVNPDYSSKNNLYSLRLALGHLSSTYVIPCDIWCRHNPYKAYELYPWYMVSNEPDTESSVKINRKMELIKTADYTGGNKMIGIAYLSRDVITFLQKQLLSFTGNPRYDNAFWEETLFDRNKMILSAKFVPATEVIEINTFEQLRELDHSSSHIKNRAIQTICDCMQVPVEEIRDIQMLKKGMTNRSFLFKCRGKKYIMRIPGEGTEKLVNRKHEAAVYDIISDRQLCDNILYINPDTGYKITEYLENTRTCDPSDDEDLKKCMQLLHRFHDMKLTVEHEFNIWKDLEFYESLWEGKPSVYPDYPVTKEHVLSLKKYIDAQPCEKILTHIDANQDNFLFYKDSSGTEQLRLVDWEYAGMQDPHLDLAMFCIYALYDKEQTDHLLSIYFEGECPVAVRIKIYCYMAACGLLWSNWCEYKQSLGIEFGEYSLRQYRYAKDFYRIVTKMLTQHE